MNDDKCQRCGDGPDPDLRTLHMACFYAMDELGLPFGEYAITGEVRELVGEERKSFGLGGPKHRLPKFAEPTGKKEDSHEHRYFTLRVCKDCRADWMAAIEAWFKAKNDPNFWPVCPKCTKNSGSSVTAVRHRTGPCVDSGIFVRRNGATVEITEEEWYRLNPGREPVRVRSTNV